MTSCVIKPKRHHHTPFPPLKLQVAKIFLCFLEPSNPPAPNKNQNSCISQCTNSMPGLQEALRKSMISLHPRNHSPRWILPLSPFYKEGNWGSESLRNLPKAIQRTEWQHEAPNLGLSDPTPLLLTTHINPVPVLIWKAQLSASQSALKYYIFRRYFAL